MRAITMSGPGGPEVLMESEVEAPVAGPGEVVVSVAAAGVNRADLLQRMGFYPPPPGASDVIGLECSGTVVAPGTTAWPTATPVCALLSGGGYASQVSVPVGQLMPVPAGVDLIQAAALPEVACTVYSNLAMVAGLTAGEWVLIHGGAGGVGSFAVQWAHAIGARVVATAGSDEKAARCRQWGADVAVNYRTQDFTAVIREVTEGRGVDVILDVMGAKYLDANVSVLATGGRLVVIGLQGGVKGELDLAALLSRQGSLFTTSLRAQTPSRKAEICARVVADVWPMIADGRIAPVVDGVMPLASVRAAHERMAESAHTGKILLAL